MKKLFTKGGAGVAAFAVFLGVTALASTYFPTFYHHFTPVLGGWSTYEVNDSAGGDSVLTFAVVAKEGDAYWIELRTPGVGGTAIVAYLVNGDPADDKSVMMLRAKDPGSPALEISRETLNALKSQGRKAFGGSAASIGPPVGKIKLLKNDKIIVGKRELVCRHLILMGAKDNNAEVWISDKVVPFGIVRLKSGEDSLTLKDFGGRAKPMLKGPFTKLAVP